MDGWVAECMGELLEVQKCRRMNFRAVRQVDGGCEGKLGVKEDAEDGNRPLR